ncbi:MAG TPA: AIR synthase-related protein, partial [Longimicrobiaceae bacterium]
TIGMVGIVEDVARVTTAAFKAEGDAIVLAGANTDELGGSEYLKVIHGLVAGDAPRVDLAAESRLQRGVLAAIHSGLVRSAHDTAEGGLAVALAESAFAAGGDPFGIDVALDDAIPANALLFGEAQGRVVLSCEPAKEAELIRCLQIHGVPARRIGTVGERGGVIRIATQGGEIRGLSTLLQDIHENAIPRRMDNSAADVETALESEVHRG